MTSLDKNQRFVMARWHELAMLVDWRLVIVPTLPVLTKNDDLLCVRHSLLPSVANEPAFCLRGQDPNGTLRLKFEGTACRRMMGQSFSQGLSLFLVQLFGKDPTATGSRCEN